MLNRRALFAGFGGLAVASLVGVAEAKPRDCMPPKFLRCGNPTASPTPPSSGISAPLAPFTVGTEVGVPTGTSLTPTSGLPAADATESLTLTHPITGAQTNRTVSVWRRRRWTTTMTATPPSGATYLFDECEFDVDSDFRTARIIDTNGVNDQMQPLAVFRRCTFDGNDTCGRGLQAAFSWVIACHMTGAADAMAGGEYGVMYDSNFVSTTDTTNPDPHSDGYQSSGTGHITHYHNWLNTGVPGASGGIRIGTEDSASDVIQIYYCGFGFANWQLQIRGDSGPGDITNLDVEHCRFLPVATGGQVDAQQVTLVTWVDNKMADGTDVPGP